MGLGARVSHLFGLGSVSRQLPSRGKVLINTTAAEDRIGVTDVGQQRAFFLGDSASVQRILHSPRIHSSLVLELYSG
jgi:hypothetical protein